MFLILNKVVHFPLWSYLRLHNGLMEMGPFNLSVLFTTLSIVKVIRISLVGGWMSMELSRNDSDRGIQNYLERRMPQ